VEKKQNRKLNVTLSEKDVERLKVIVAKVTGSYRSWNHVSKEMDCGLTPVQCRYIWHKKYDPQYKHGPWTGSEVDLLAECIKDSGRDDELRNIAREKIPWRNTWDITEMIAHLGRPKASKASEKVDRLVNLSEDESIRFVEIVKEEMKKESRASIWKFVSVRMNCSLSVRQCRYIWHRKYDPLFNHGPWTAKERALLNKCESDVAGSGGSLLDALCVLIPWRNRVFLTAKVVERKRRDRKRRIR
jgi:hypothetical protein